MVSYGCCGPASRCKPSLAGGHQTVEQGNVEAVEILQSVEYAKLRTKIQMQGRVTNGSEIHEHHVAVSLLQSHCGVDGSGGRSGASFGAEESENARLPSAASEPGFGWSCNERELPAGLNRQNCRDTLKRRRALPTDRRWIVHLAIGEDGNLQSGQRGSVRSREWRFANLAWEYLRSRLRRVSPESGGEWHR